MSGPGPRNGILQRLLLDEASPLEAFERSELAGDPAARAELEELLAGVRRLEALGASERAALAGPPRDAAAEERVLARLREHVARHAPAPRRRLPALRWAAALAAGFVLLLGLRSWFLTAEGPGPDTPLGAAPRIEILRPVGEVDTFAQIGWSGERPGGARFVVRVYDAAGTELAASPLLEENRWSPAPEAWTSWPDEIRLRVELHGEGPDELLGRSSEVRARRSP